MHIRAARKHSGSNSFLILVFLFCKSLNGYSWLYIADLFYILCARKSYVSLRLYFNQVGVIITSIFGRQSRQRSRSAGIISRLKNTVSWFFVREKYCSGWKNKLNKTDYKQDEQGHYSYTARYSQQKKYSLLTGLDPSTVPSSALCPKERHACLITIW
jgi:hypothetical protein